MQSDLLASSPALEFKLLNKELFRVLLKNHDDPPWNCHFLLWVPFSSFWTQGTLTYSIQFRSGFTSLRKPPQTTVGWLLSFVRPHISLHKVSITLFFTLCWYHRYYVCLPTEESNISNSFCSLDDAWLTQPDFFLYASSETFPPFY